MIPVTGTDTERQELEDQAGLANVAELAGPVAHEVNNFLNALLLQLAVLEQLGPENLRSDLVEIRRQGKALATIVQQWQQYRRRQQAALRPTDLNRILAQALAVCMSDATPGAPAPWAVPQGDSTPASSPPDGVVPVHLVLAPELPPILAPSGDLKRLCAFLLANAAAAAGSQAGRITARTEAVKDLVRLRLEDTGPAVPPEALPHFFEPGPAPRPGTNSLELAACGGIVRRLQGRIRAENQPVGLAVIVELPAAAGR
jgi:signal transduction histidine kinase